MKFLILWALVIMADFILEFRFEFLWPFYLLLRSVYDSFKYQGMAFSVFFVCVALTSDMLCFFFIPVNWLFFAASTYVWVQFVWHTDRGICAPTVVLWMVFVYLEAAVRLRDVKHMPGHLDLCRPFAAHCIGYPVVTLGFGFKSYIGFRMRQKKQKDVAKENEFYQQLMQQALPVEAAPQTPTSTAILPQEHNHTTSPQATTQLSTAVVTTRPHHVKQDRERNGHVPNGIPNGLHGQRSHRKSVDKAKEAELEHKERHSDRQRMGNGTVTGAGTEETVAPEPEPKPSGRRREKKEQDKDREAAEYLQRMEMDVKRLRTDLQSSRASEQELRLQVILLTP